MSEGAHKCRYKEDIEMLKKAYADIRTDLATLQTELRTELKGIKGDIGEIKQKLDGVMSDIMSVRTDIGYLRGVRQAKGRNGNANSYWMRFSVGMVKDLAVLALMGLISLKAFGVV